MTDVIAPSTAASARLRIGLAFLALTGAGVAAFYAPQIAQGFESLVDPCATSIEKPDISKLMGVGPMGEGGVAAVQPFVLTAANPAERERAVRCLTDAIYYEAAREPEQGQRAIAQVVLNRVRDKHFPKSVCGVVYEGWRRQTGCQFSFVCDGSIQRRRADPAAWSRLRPLAEQALSGYVVPAVGTSTHYYATYVRPNWLRSVAQITEIGKHVFCSWKGKAGLPTSLASAYGGNEFQVADAALDGARPAAPKPVRAERKERRGRVHARYV